MGQRKEARCPTCLHSLRRGLLWLRGKDYVECPDCGGTGTFVMYEQLVTPGRSILVPGRRDALPDVAVAHKVRDQLVIQGTP